MRSTNSFAELRGIAMKICMIAYSVYERDNRVMRYAETLARRGDQVDAVALSSQDLTHDSINGVNLFRVQRRTYREKGRLSYLLRVLLFFWRAMMFVIRRQARMRYDIIHIHSVPDFLVFSAWFAKLFGTKLILDVHDVLPELYASKFHSSEKSFTYKVLLAVERWSAAFAHHVIIANDIWRQKLVARSVPAWKCTTLLNFPDRSIFRRQGRTRADNKFVMIYPGTLNWHQGVDLAIRALADIQEEAPAAELHIYGTGPNKESLVALARELGLSDRVQFMGYRNLWEIPQAMEDADLGVVPKRNDRFGDEAFSTKVLEFMALGVPVLLASTKVDRYYFNDSIVKFFRAGDEKDLADSMLSLVRNPQVRRTLASNAARFIKHYDWDSHKGVYLDIVDTLCPNGSHQHCSPVSSRAHSD